MSPYGMKVYKNRISTGEKENFEEISIKDKNKKTAMHFSGKIFFLQLE